MSAWRLKIMLALTLPLAAAAAYGNAFFGSNPQPGYLQWSGFSDGSVGVTINDPGLGVNNFSPNAGQFYGSFNPAAEGGGATFGPDDFFRFFCVDITHSVSGSAITYTRSIPALDPTRSAELTWLFDLYYPNKATGTYYSGGVQTNFGDFPNADTSAAFQVALWEIWFDSGLSLSSGNFTATSSDTTMINLAQGYLNAVGAASGTPPTGWTFYEFSSGSDHCCQDYLSVEYSQTLHSTPEPDALLLFASAVIAAGVAALRRRQTA